jgi:hypothetical protein
MVKIPYWGESGWLAPKLPQRKWHLILANSFEDRSVAVIESANLNEIDITSNTIFEIENPPSASWEKAKPKLASNLKIISQQSASPGTLVLRFGLLDVLPWEKIKTNLLNNNVGSVIVDISCMPKRHFALCIRKLMQMKEIEELVVAYSVPESYPERALFMDVKPEASLPGFMRMEDLERTQKKRSVRVSVGYTARGLDSVMSSSGTASLELVFPFPPGSPSFRRNWKFLSEITLPNAPVLKTHMVYGYDAFSVFNLANQWASTSDIYWYAYGSKPHTLGAVMAYLKNETSFEIRYSQPQTYDHEYSKGIQRNPDDSPTVFLYCLRINRKSLF